jgi:hypothetical protein
MTDSRRGKHTNKLPFFFSLFIVLFCSRTREPFLVFLRCLVFSLAHSDEWIHRFGEIQRKIKGKASDEKIKELKGLE